MAINFFDHNLNELSEVMVEQGQKGFRAQQLFRWVYAQGVSDFTEMTNISKDFRAQLPELISIQLPVLVKKLVSTDGTKKFLFELNKGETVEAVLIPGSGRQTLCVSSEIGCNMACRFCYTGKQKLKRRLTAGEIVGQVLSVQRLQNEDGGESISNVVFMGMGEPLDNTEAVFKSAEIMHSTWGLNLSRKKITVSTSGLVPQIPLVTKAKLRLAVSLNAVDDETRSKIMPINKKWPIAQLLEACRVHAREARDLVTVEYVLLRDVTDSLKDAEKLYHLTKTLPCKLNIIPFNEHPGSGFHRPSEERIQAFQKKLMNLGKHVLRRKTMGRDIYAACGQLTTAAKEHDDRLNI